MITKNQNETIEIGEKIATQLNGGDIICLYGELGAGKTTLVKGIATGLGVINEITSPTFTLMNLYAISSHKSEILNLKSKITTLIHIDTYRLKNEQELIQIGAEDYIGEPNTITVIEWPEKITNLLKNKTIKKISIEHGVNDTRKITIS